MKDDAQTLKSSSQLDAPALAGHYLRSFAATLRQIDAFEAFFDTLSRIIEEDPYLEGAARLSSCLHGPIAAPDFEALDANDTVLSVTGANGNSGFLQYKGRRDGEPFSSEDVHLMAAIAGFVASVTAQADRFREQSETIRLFQYLVNQLPLGVVCFRSNGDLLIANKVAGRLLGEAGAGLLTDALDEAAMSTNGSLQLHLEAEGTFLFVEGRCLEVEKDLFVNAFVLYDMSRQREKLFLQVERAAYRTESRGTALTLALFEDHSRAGLLYGELKKSAELMRHCARTIQPLDAYSCACVFEGKSMASARELLRTSLADELAEADTVRAALVSEWHQGGDESPAESLIHRARGDLVAIGTILRPAILVLDPYQGVFDALRVIASDFANLHVADSPEEAGVRLSSGEYDAVFIDIDSYPPETCGELWPKGLTPDGAIRFYYASQQHPEVTRSKYPVLPESAILQKPFDANELCRLLASDLNFS